MNARARITALLSGLVVLAAVLTPLPASADDAPTSTPDARTGTTAPAAYAGAGPVTIDNSTTPFLAVTPVGGAGNWPDSTTFTYQWYRGASVGTATTPATGAGAATASYTPNTADSGQFLRVRATATVPGSSPATIRYSAAADYSLRQDAPISIGGLTTVGAVLSAGTTTYNFPGGGANSVPAVTVTGYQWFRSGVAIPTATASTYRLTASDLGKTVVVKVTAQAAGWAPGVFPSTPTAAVAPAVFGGTQTVQIAGPTASVLSAVIPGGSITDANADTGAPAYLYQWLRGSTIVKTAPSYTLTAADLGTTTGIRVTVTKPGYTTVTLNATIQATLVATGPVQITGVVVQGSQLTAVPPPFTVGGVAAFPSFTYQWLRDGAAIATVDGIGDDKYTPVTADKGHALAARLTATVADRPATVVTSPATQKVGVTAFSGIDDPVLLSACCTNGKLTVSNVGLTPVGAYTYQWYRGAAAIAGATGSSYVLTAADRGTLTRVRVVATKSGFTTVVKYSVAQDFSILADTAPVVLPEVGGRYEVGDEMSIIYPSYTLVGGGGVTVSKAIQWYRNGAAVAGATAPTYVLKSTDFGATITVRVIASAAGWNSVTGISQATPAVAKGTLHVANNTPFVTGSGAILTATLPGGTVTTREVIYAYQWFRGGTAIAGDTHQTHTLTSADADKQLSVRVIVSKANMTPTSVTLPTSPGIDYTIHSTTPVINGTNKVGETVYAFGGSYTSAVGNPLFPFETMQWYRSGVAIPGENGNSYELKAADLNKAITARITATASGYLTRTFTAAPSTAITGVGVIVVAPGGFVPQMVPGVSAGQLHQSIQGGITTPGVTYSYQWKRNGANVPGATGLTFALAATDADKLISYTVKVTKPGYSTLSFDATPHWFGIEISSAAVVIPIYGDGKVGGALHVSYADGPWHWQYSETNATVTPTLKYQWYRANVAIAGAIASAYSPVAADYNKRLSVRVYASGPGLVAASSLSGETDPPIALGQNVSPGTAAVEENLTTDTLHAFLIAGSLDPASPAPAVTYQWMRRPGAQPAQVIPGATKSTYKLSTADLYKHVWVKITVHRTNFVPAAALYDLESDEVFYTPYLGFMPHFATTPVFGQALAAPSPAYVDEIGDGIPGTPKFTYQWFRNSAASVTGGTLIAGATGATYKPAVADIGKYLFVNITVKFPGLLSFTTPSYESAQVQAADLGFSGFGYIVTTFSNVAKRQLKPSFAALGSFAVAPTSYTYQWLRGGVTIPGATSSLYTLAAADTGFYISVRVTAHKVGYGDVVPTAIGTLYSITLDTPELNGNLYTDNVVSADVQGITSPVPVDMFAYQWYRRNDTSGAVVKLPGATHQTYKILASDVGWVLYALVHAVKPGYLTPSAVTETGTVVPASFAGSASTPLPSVSGHLVSSNFNEHGITTPGVTYRYEWFHNDVQIVGATKATYTSPSLPAGKYTVVVFVTKPGYTSQGLSGSITIV